MKHPLFVGFLPFRTRLNPTRPGIHRSRYIVCALFLLTACSASPSELAEDVLVPFRNAGMEEGTGSPAGWQQGPAVAGVQQQWDKSSAHTGKASLCLRKTAQRYFPIAQWSQFLQVEPAKTPRKVRIRCWVKAEALTKAIIDVVYQNGPQRSGHAWAVYLGQKQNTEPLLTQDWKLCEGIVEVPANTSKIGIAFQIYGPGSVWFDDLQVAWVS